MSIVLTIFLCLVAALWLLIPFALFGVRARLAAVEDAYRRHTDELTKELHRLNWALTEHGHHFLIDPAASDRTLLVRYPAGRA